MNDWFWRGVFVVCILMLGVLAWSFLVVDEGSATYYVIQIAAVHVVAAMILITILLRIDWDPFRAFR